MSDEKKAGPGGIGAAVIGFIIAAIVGVITVQDGAKKPAPVTPKDPPSDTAPAVPTDTGPGIVIEPEPVEPPEPERVVTEADPISTKPGRTRIVFPVPRVTPECVATARRWIAGAREQYGEGVGKAYGYLLDRCDLVSEALASGLDPVIWLAREGYDSPAAECGMRYRLDRRIRPGDNVAIRLTEEGALRYVWRVGSWEPVEGMMLARVLEQSPTHWLVTSFGRHVLVPIAEHSSTLDRAGWNVVATEIGGEMFEAPVDPNAETLAPEIMFPCVRGWESAAQRMVWGIRTSMRLGE